MKSAPVYATFLVEPMYPSILRRSAAIALLRLAAGASALGDTLLRPREVRLTGADEDGVEALVERVFGVGSELRAELRLADGSALWAQLDRSRAEELELREGQIVGVHLGDAAARRELPAAA
jgi:hypothetical protein